MIILHLVSNTPNMFNSYGTWKGSYMELTFKGRIISYLLVNRKQAITIDIGASGCIKDAL